MRLVTALSRALKYYLAMMELAKDQLELYQLKLAAIAELDRAYYRNSNPTRVERAEYFWRKELLDRLRARLYAQMGKPVRIS